MHGEEVAGHRQDVARLLAQRRQFQAAIGQVVAQALVKLANRRRTG